MATPFVYKQSISGNRKGIRQQLKAAAVASEGGCCRCCNRSGEFSASDELSCLEQIELLILYQFGPIDPHCEMENSTHGILRFKFLRSRSPPLIMMSANETSSYESKDDAQ